VSEAQDILDGIRKLGRDIYDDIKRGQVDKLFLPVDENGKLTKESVKFIETITGRRYIMKCGACGYQHFEIQNKDGEFETTEGDQAFIYSGKYSHKIEPDSPYIKEAVLLACPKCKTLRIE